MTTQGFHRQPPSRKRVARRVATAAFAGMALGGFAVAQPAFADPAYIVTPIPGVDNLNVNGIYNTRLNQWGQFVVSANSGDYGPMLWTPTVDNGTSGSMIDLSKQPGYPPLARATYKGDPTAINDAGEVVGDAYMNVNSGGDANGVLSWVYVPKTLNSSIGVLHSGKGGKVTAFPITPGGLSQYPSSINASGFITGHGGYYNPFLFTPTTPNTATGNWSTDPNSSVDYFFINNAGLIGGGVYSGFFPNGGSQDYAFEQSGFPPISEASLLSSPEWATPSNADAFGINQLGDLIVNTVAASDHEGHAYLVKSGTVTDVGGGDPATALAINDSDMITGGRIEGPAAIAFLYTNGTAYDLNTLVPTTNGFSVNPEPGPVAINDKGQILTGGGDNFGDGVFLLTPAALIPGKQPKIASSAAHSIGVGQFTRVVKLTNSTGATLTGPVSVAFDGLPANVTVVSPAGTTAFAGPAGSPYVNVTANNVAPLGVVSLTVTFNAPSAASIVYTARALEGTAPR